MKNEINHSHLTAIERTKLSFPTQWLISNNKLEGEILDFGCGFGYDVIDLKIKVITSRVTTNIICRNIQQRNTILLFVIMF